MAEVMSKERVLSIRGDYEYRSGPTHGLAESHEALRAERDEARRERDEARRECGIQAQMAADSLKSAYDERDEWRGRAGELEHLLGNARAWMMGQACATSAIYMERGALVGAINGVLAGREPAGKADDEA